MSFFASPKDPAEARDSSPSTTVSIRHAPFGELADGSEVSVYTLKNGELEIRLTTFGARVVAIRSKDRDGRMDDVALGYDTLDAYLDDTKTYVGAIAGRYANRIDGGQFALDGKTHQIPTNDGTNALHGGPKGFDRHNWTASEIVDGVEFSLTSPDGENGFPGTLTVHARYVLQGNTVRMELNATTDQATVLNLTNHAYFNLAGDAKGDILDHLFQLDADHYVPVNANLIPTGQLAPVAGSPMDFTSPSALRSRVDGEEEQLKLGWGYDHTFVIRGKNGELRPAARVHDPSTGRVLAVQTTEPGVQFYSGNHLDGSSTGRSGGKYEYRMGFCLETQHYPDSPNQPSFPSTVLRPGETLHSVTTWTFTAEA